MTSEDEQVARILEVAGDTGLLRVRPGHDCAAVDVPGGVAVVTTDVLVDGVHFRLDEDGAYAAARKALLVNLSDLAAAGARPLACEVGLVFPSDRDPALLEDLARGLADVARRYGCPLAGGDTNVADGPLVLAVTVIGEPGPRGLVTRAGAKVGDRLAVTGPLGGSLAGRHLAFVPRLAAGAVLADRGIAHAMMDLSDGLGSDLPRLCRASGVGARIDAERVPVHPDAAGADGLEHALRDGEDFELLVAHGKLGAEDPAALAAAGVVLHDIGEVVAADEGIHLVRTGVAEPWSARGYDHFARAFDAGETWSVVVGRPADMRALGVALGRAALGGVEARGIVVALEGDLGAGKTVFVQGVARGFGVPADEDVVSPTFTIARSYAAPGAPPRLLHHVDAYRLLGAEQLEHAGFEDMCGKGSLTCVEWAGRVEEGLPSDRIEIAIALLPGETPPRPGEAPEAPRRVVVAARGPRARAVVAAWRREAEVEP